MQHVCMYVSMYAVRTARDTKVTHGKQNRSMFEASEEGIDESKEKRRKKKREKKKRMEVNRYDTHTCTLLRTS